MMSWYEKASCITGPWWWESTRVIGEFPTLMASSVELWCCFCSLRWTSCWMNSPVADRLRLHDAHMTTMKWNLASEPQCHKSCSQCDEAKCRSVCVMCLSIWYWLACFLWRFNSSILLCNKRRYNNITRSSNCRRLYFILFYFFNKVIWGDKSYC